MVQIRVTHSRAGLRPRRWAYADGGDVYHARHVTVHSPLSGLVVIPAKAGIHAWRLLDSRLRGNDDKIGGAERLPQHRIGLFHNFATENTEEWEKMPSK